MAAMTLRKILYGATFVGVIPAFLILWAIRAEPNITLPAYGGSALGIAFALGGIAIMLAAMLELWRFGGGLPMNAFPPPKFVQRGTFQWFAHPIYTGFAMAVYGVSMAAHSPAGLWLVTPVTVLGCAALVLGYEHPDMVRRFGRTLQILPADDDKRPSNLDRVHYYICAALPWVALYEFTVQMHLPGASFGFGFEDRLPIWSWTALVYQSIYAVAAAAPWYVRTRRDLRRLIVSLWFSEVVIFLLYWVLPSSAPRRPIAAHGWMVPALRFERDTYPPVAAFPSFHVLWAVFLARAIRPRWLGFAFGAAISVTCITTGQHYILDVAVSLLISPVFLFPERVWEFLRKLAERIANSWREWRVGPVRIISHGAYAGLAAFIHLGIAMSAAGPERAPQLLATAFAGLAGAAVWAQWVEGSSGLRRPFGFYGGLIAVALSCLLFDDRWILLGAHCLGAPWLQAIGRLRCLANGCCHGRPAPAKVGIAVVAQRSRVTRLAGLGGVPIHPTQLYSILGNTAIGALLLRVWAWNGRLSIVCGVYLIGNGLARFVEEAYRGEPQTRAFGGLRMYQWLAVLSVVTGSSPRPPWEWISRRAIVDLRGWRSPAPRANPRRSGRT